MKANIERPKTTKRNITRTPLNPIMTLFSFSTNPINNTFINRILVLIKRLLSYIQFKGIPQLVQRVSTKLNSSFTSRA